MQDGCLSEWADVVDNHLHLALKRVKRALLVEVATQLFRDMHQPMDVFFLPMVDIYLTTHTITPGDLKDEDIGEFYQEKLYHIMKNM